MTKSRFITINYGRFWYYVGMRWESHRSLALCVNLSPPTKPSNFRPISDTFGRVRRCRRALFVRVYWWALLGPRCGTSKGRAFIGWAPRLGVLPCNRPSLLPSATNSRTLGSSARFWWCLSILFIRCMKSLIPHGGCVPFCRGASLVLPFPSSLSRPVTFSPGILGRKGGGARGFVSESARCWSPIFCGMLFFWLFMGSFILSSCGRGFRLGGRTCLGICMGLFRRLGSILSPGALVACFGMCVHYWCSWRSHPFC